MDLAIKFWEKWLEEDSLKRHKLLENMMITKELVDYNYNKCNRKISKRRWMHMVTQNLDGIFQDLISTIDYLDRKKQNKIKR